MTYHNVYLQNGYQWVGEGFGSKKDANERAIEPGLNFKRIAILRIYPKESHAC